jgi:hypothetical protein
MRAEVEAYRDAAAAALGLTLSPESRAGVAANLTVLFAMAGEMEAVELAPEDDPLPVFRP